jgi:hypothetical protein
MKNVLTVFIASLSLSAVGAACVPPPSDIPAFEIQKTWLSKIIKAPIVNDKIQQLSGTNGIITELRLTREGYEIVLNNSCHFTVLTDYTNASPGHCPELLPLKIINEFCPAP